MSNAGVVIHRVVFSFHVLARYRFNVLLLTSCTFRPLSTGMRFERFFFAVQQSLNNGKVLVCGGHSRDDIYYDVYVTMLNGDDAFQLHHAHYIIEAYLLIACDITSSVLYKASHKSRFSFGEYISWSTRFSRKMYLG